MKYLLDTNICIYLMKEQPPSVAERFSRLQVGDVGISSITMAELEHGAGADPELAASRRAQLKALAKVIPSLPFDDDAARDYGLIRNGSKQLGRNRFDTLIAAQALARQLILVTNNLADFSGIPGLALENWIEA
ncbi:MAG: type II toxin-antitoxin system VapC family toxin [Clostridia bacterium]